MVVYPMSAAEDFMVRWVARLAPMTAMVVIVLLGALSAALP